MTSEEGFLEIVIEVEFGKMAFTDIFMQVEDMRNTAGESITTYNYSAIHHKSPKIQIKITSAYANQSR